MKIKWPTFLFLVYFVRLYNFYDLFIVHFVLNHWVLFCVHLNPELRKYLSKALSSRNALSVSSNHFYLKSLLIYPPKHLYHIYITNFYNPIFLFYSKNRRDFYNHTFPLLTVIFYLALYTILKFSHLFN